MKDRDEVGRFLKGIVPWSKGKKIPHTEEEKQKISEAQKGMVWSAETRRKISLATKGHRNFLGKKHSKETKEKLSAIFKGNKYCLGRKMSTDQKKQLSEIKKGNKYSLGLKRSIETKKKLSEQKKGDGNPAKNPVVRAKISKTLKGRFVGKRHPNWKGGGRLAGARQNHKRNERGFVLLTDKNPYTEPFEYHHIHPNLPYVVPCPKRIHQIFLGKTHFQNVNAMLGFRFEVEELCNQNVKSYQSNSDKMQ